MTRLSVGDRVRVILDLHAGSDQYVDFNGMVVKVYEDVWYDVALDSPGEDEPIIDCFMGEELALIEGSLS